MLRGQANRMMYVKQLLRDSCCETVDELQPKMNNRAEWARVSHTTSSSESLRSFLKWMDGLTSNISLYNSAAAHLHGQLDPRCNCFDRNTNFLSNTCSRQYRDKSVSRSVANNLHTTALTSHLVAHIKCAK